MINNNSVAYTSILWPNISSKKRNQPAALNQILKVNQAVLLSANNLATFLKNPVTIIGVDPTYANTGDKIIPAYALITSAGDKLIIDATTGKLVR